MAQEKWLIEGPKTIDIDSARTLKVGLIGGQIDIVAHDEPGVRVEVHSVSGKPLKVSIDGDTVEIDHPQLGWDNWLDVFRSWTGRTMRADVSVMVPRDIGIKLGVVSASALVSGVSRDASLSTVSGDLVLDSITGALQLNSVSGELTIRNHGGRVGAHSVSGDITAEGALTTFSADTVSGSVFLDTTGIPGEIKVNTVSGGVTLRLEADIPASYTISTVGGRLQLDDAQISGVKGRYSGRFGQLDKHWVDLRVNSVGGDVSVLRTVKA